MHIYIYHTNVDYGHDVFSLILYDLLLLLLQGGAHTVTLDMDVLVHIVKAPMRRFSCYVYRLDRTIDEDQIIRKQRSRKGSFHVNFCSPDREPADRSMITRVRRTPRPPPVPDQTESSMDSEEASEPEPCHSHSITITRLAAPPDQHAASITPPTSSSVSLSDNSTDSRDYFMDIGSDLCPGGPERLGAGGGRRRSSRASHSSQSSQSSDSVRGVRCVRERPGDHSYSNYFMEHEDDDS